MLSEFSILTVIVRYGARICYGYSVLIQADALIGIYPEPAACSTSGVLTFDLTPYKQTGLNETNTSIMESTVVNP